MCGLNNRIVTKESEIRNAAKTGSSSTQFVRTASTLTDDLSLCDLNYTRMYSNCPNERSYERASINPHRNERARNARETVIRIEAQIKSTGSDAPQC